MTKETLFLKLDDLLDNKKSRAFLDHLIISYFPVDKVDKVFMKPKDVHFKCSLTNKPLISVNGLLLESQTESFKNELFRYLHVMFEPDNKVKPPLTKLLERNELAVQGTNTSTYLSLHSYLNFTDWLMTKILKGDKHINWVIKKNISSSFDSKKPKEKEIEVKTASYSLGEFPELKALKEKMLKSGN